MKSKKNLHKRIQLTKEEQILAGLEYLTLGKKLVIQDKKINQTQLFYLLEELNSRSHEEEIFSEEKEKFLDEKYSIHLEKKSNNEAEKFRKKYEGYKKLLYDKFQISIDLQKRIVSNFHDRNFKNICNVCSFYLSKLSVFVSEESIQLFVKNLPKPSDALYYLVFLKYAVRFQWQITFRYQKIMGKENTRKVRAYSIAMKNGYLSFIGEDSDGEIKSFILSSIVKIETDFFKILNQPQTTEKEIFNIENFESKNPSAVFYREKVIYEIEMAPNTFQHFKQTYNFDYKIYSETEKKVTIQIETTDFFKISHLLFDYGTFCKLIRPEEKVKSFQEKIQDIKRHYDEENSFQ